MSARAAAGAAAAAAAFGALVGIALGAGCASGGSSDPAAARPDRWFRGNTHVHSGNSGDSVTPPEEVAAWYERAGFDFIIFTDHSFVTAIPWSGRLLVIPGVEVTRNVRLPAEGPAAEGLPMHVNALFVPPERAGPLPPVAMPGPEDLRESIYAGAIALAASLGGLPALNHPTFHGAVDSGLLVRLAGRGLRFFEVANASIDVHNEGEAGGASTETMWNAVLDAGNVMYGLASDDAHHYADADDVERAGMPAFRPGRGWIMVHAAACTPAALRAALEAGDFYGSWGPTLTAVERGPGTLRLAAATPMTFRFVGAGGAVLAEERGVTTAAYALRPGEPWVRAVVTDSTGRAAWIQPVFAAR